MEATSPAPFGFGISRPLVLAPMAELSHVALRMLIRQTGGCQIFFTEMLSANLLVKAGPARSVFLIQDPSEQDLVHQLTGSDPAIMASAAALLQERGVRRIDLNMGCSAPLIVQRGEGAALMRDAPRALAMVRAVRQAFDGHLSAKLRLGWELDRDRLLSFCRMLAGEGVQTITLHPRLRQEKFRGHSRWEWIGWLKENLSLPVVGNGDIRAAADGRRMLAETGCDGIMIGRGALIRPGLFRELATGGSTAAAPLDLLLEFNRLLQAYLPEKYWLGRLQIFAGWYCQSLKFGHTLHTRLRACPDLEAAGRVIRDFFAE